MDHPSDSNAAGAASPMIGAVILTLVWGVYSIYITYKIFTG